MAIDLITGHQSVSHISADQIATINNAMMDNFGANKVMRLVGGELTADGLTITISEGYWRVNGFDMEIQEGETLYIDPTTIGLSRIDDIYVEILQDIPTGAQRAEIYIALGEPSATPTAPDEPTAPYLNTDILLQIIKLARVTVSEGAMIMEDYSVAYNIVTPEDLAEVQTEVDTIVNVYGAKNVVDIAQRYRVGETFAKGLYTINADRTISVNANTASSGTIRLLPNADNELFILPKGDYIFSAEGSTKDYYLVYRIAVGGEEVGNTRNGNICEIHSDGTLGIIVLIRKNVNTALTTPLIIKPMIRLASIQDDTYVPYAKTNKELTDAFTNQVADSDDAYSPSKAYKVGEHCIYNNKVYKCITACSAAAWSVNQNCFEETTLTTAVTELNSDLNDYQLKGWTYLGQVKGTRGVTIPSSAKEIAYIAKSPFYDWYGIIPHVNTERKQIVHIGNYYGSDFTDTQKIAFLYENGAIWMLKAIQDGRDNTSNAYVNIWYR